MLQIARERAGRLGLAVDLCQGDAQALDFPDASFDTVVCTFSLCAIPDDRMAVAEMARVLRVAALGFTIEGHDRFKLGIVERLAARKPLQAGQPAG
jgi:ubiquinone/menaquinone biosynthesis C-methylase UbiE